ncbi:DNA-binding transcriptional ArsR family regulator [Pseudoduganella flava]|uniref:DNA-binding transcriptional ArsR family regulator n=1 Tax=Pseudoduganella flava TaxID=871742 RepID=A0A562Q3C5_9BURK|nr:helix-turn-helix domain-containing protein [Pseudoduganella flava]QGZ41266.1 metalloregulator ArsR/SmtB family transcription factor [Pseudoduganella flava]TWI51203.1 DNA-binding transcriptional ArsR family regulator [Pseudoduganella flava]
MDAPVHADTRLARIAAAIAEPARARMLCSLLDGHARTSTELAVVAEVSPSTASAHLAKLKDEGLLEQLAQGKHRYYSLAGQEVAAALEALLVVAGVPRVPFTPTTPTRLRNARTCYDHMAGTVAVALHDRLLTQGWLVAADDGYALTPAGTAGCAALGLDVAALRQRRRRFACPCLDWSERRAHLGGALGAALLRLALDKGWVEQDLDSRALAVPPAGRRRLEAVFGIQLAE